MDFDPRDVDDARDDARWGYDRDLGGRGAGDVRDRGDPRDAFVDGLDLPRGLERELVQDQRESLYELNGEDSRTLAAVGAFRVVSERDLADSREAPSGRHDSVDHLRDEGLIRSVSLDGHERGVTLTDRGRDVLETHRRERTERHQAFHSGVSRARELRHDSRLYRAYLRAERRLRDTGASIHRVVLEVDLKREYQQFLQAHNRGRSDSDGRPDRSARDIEAWAHEHDLPYLDASVQFPDFRIEYEREGRDDHEDIEVLTEHYRGAHASSRGRARFTCYRSGSRSGDSIDPGLAEDFV